MRYLLLALFLATLAPASAETYAIVCVVNASNSPKDVSYTLRWGDGEWKQFKLAPGKRYIHSWRLDEGEADPRVSLKYDQMMDSGQPAPYGGTIEPYIIDEALTTKRLDSKTSQGAPQYWFRLSDEGGDFSVWEFKRS